MLSKNNEGDIKKSLWYQQHLEKLRNKGKKSVETVQRKVDHQPAVTSKAVTPTSTVTKASQNTASAGSRTSQRSIQKKPAEVDSQPRATRSSLNTGTAHFSAPQKPSPCPTGTARVSAPQKASPCPTGTARVSAPQKASPCPLDRVSSDSSVLTLTPVSTSTPKQPNQLSTVKSRVSAEIDKINSRHSVTSNTVTQIPSKSTAEVEKSTAYLEHLKKLKEKASSNKADSSDPQGQENRAAAKEFAKPQADAYAEHLKKLQAKTSPSQKNLSTNKPNSVSDVPQRSIRTISPITTVKTEVAGERVSNKQQSGRRNLVPVKTEASSPKGKNMPRSGATGKDPRRNQDSSQSSKSEIKSIPTHTTTPKAQTVDNVLSTVNRKSPQSGSLHISDEEEFVTLDYVGEDEESFIKNDVPFIPNKNGTYCKELPKSNKKAPLKSILKRSHDNRNNDINSAKVPRSDSTEARVKPNLPRHEQDAIEVVQSSPQDAKSNIELDNALAVGLEFIHPVTGYHCVLCQTFYHDYPAALHHCTLLAHKMKAIKEQC